MDLALFILFLLALVGLFIYLVMWERRIKNRYKARAESLLEMSDPDPREVKETIKHLRLYAGRVAKDKEAMELVSLLQGKFPHLLQ